VITNTKTASLLSSADLPKLYRLYKWPLSKSFTPEILFLDVPKPTKMHSFQATAPPWDKILWRARVLETPFGLLLRFIYDFTSRHYNYFYNVTRTRLNASSLPCWFFILVLCLLVSWLLLWSLVYLIGSFDLCSDVASLIGSFVLPGFYSLPPWNRVFGPRIEDTLSKGNFSSVVQVVTGITFVNIRWSDNNYSPSRCLGIATIHLSYVFGSRCVANTISVTIFIFSRVVFIVNTHPVAIRQTCQQSAAVDHMRRTDS
jgi:hypothetical protein